MSEAQVRADLHRSDAEEAANDEKEILSGDEDMEDGFQLDEMDDSDHGHSHTTEARAPKKMTQAAFIISGLQIEEAQ